MQFVYKVESWVPSVKLYELVEDVVSLHLTVLLLLLFVRVLMTHYHLLLSIIMNRDIMFPLADNSEFEGWRQRSCVQYYGLFNNSHFNEIRRPSKPSLRWCCPLAIWQPGVSNKLVFAIASVSIILSSNYCRCKQLNDAKEKAWWAGSATIRLDRVLGV